MTTRRKHFTPSFLFLGFYADPETDCQGYHVCMPFFGGKVDRKMSFLCPNGTIFNQELFVCDWWWVYICPYAWIEIINLWWKKSWHNSFELLPSGLDNTIEDHFRMNVDCSLAESFYSKNEQIGKEGDSGEDSGSSVSQSDESPGTNISRSGPQERPSQKTSKPSSNQQRAKSSRPKKEREREPAPRPKPKAGVFTNATLFWYGQPSLSLTNVTQWMTVTNGGKCNRFFQAPLI